MENKKEIVDTEKIQFVPPNQLYPFKDHPFKMRNGEENEQLLESIRCQGTIEPLIVRPIDDGKYEIVSGHRRYSACVELGIANIPVIVRNLTNEQAISMMVDANIHRENILPSERAFAYKMKLDAIKNQGIRTDLTSSQPAKRLNSSEVIASSFGIGKDTLYRYIRLTELIPPLIKLVDDGKYEIVSGHRRYSACVELGIANIPVIVRNLTNEQAISMMVDANIHRENILPSEKAFAYKMKLDAIKSQGVRTDLTSSQPAKRLNSSEVIASSFGIGKDTLYRYIRLTELIPPFLKLVDDGKIALTPAVELSYLTKEEQHNLMSEIEYSLSTPSLSQAQRMRSLSRQGRLSKDAIYIVMSEEKANQKEQVRFMKEDIAKYFPKNYTSKDMSEVIVRLLQNWQHKRERTSREER